MRPRTRILCSVWTFAAAALVCGPVRAQEANPDVKACDGKKKGDPCERMVIVKPADGPMERKMEPGICQPDECCALDYSKGSPPQTDCGPCLACKPEGGAPHAGDDAAAQAEDDGAAPLDPEASAAGGDGSEAPRNGPGEEPPAQSGGNQKGCTVGAASGGGLGLWPLWGIVLHRHRRRRVSASRHV